MDLFAIRAGDSVGERLRVLLSETLGEAEAGVWGDSQRATRWQPGGTAASGERWSLRWAGSTL